LGCQLISAVTDGIGSNDGAILCDSKARFPRFLLQMAIAKRRGGRRALPNPLTEKGFVVPGIALFDLLEQFSEVYIGVG